AFSGSAETHAVRTPRMRRPAATFSSVPPTVGVHVEDDSSRSWNDVLTRIIASPKVRARVMGVCAGDVIRYFSRLPRVSYGNCTGGGRMPEAASTPKDHRHSERM